jgi:VanZ family protein
VRRLRGLALYVALGWAYAGAIIYLSLTSLPHSGLEVPHVDKVLHFGAYFCLAAWFSMVVESRARWRAHAVFFALMGAGLEVAQGLGGLRQAEIADGLANLAGVLSAGWTRQWTKDWLWALEGRLGWGR